MAVRLWAGLGVLMVLVVTAAGGAGARADIAAAILDADDTARYGRIFALQEEGDWKAADREIAALGDEVLLGHVLAQRYLHPTKYRSRFAELRDWLKIYADHPDATRIHKLALRRAPNSARTSVPPPRLETRANGVAAERNGPARERLSSRAREQASVLMRQVRAELRRARPERAERHLAAKAYRAIHGTRAYDRAQLRVAKGYFGQGNDPKALALADAVAARHGEVLTSAHMIAGLAAWRLADYDLAAAHFEALANAAYASRWDRAGGAFWAARAHLVSRRPALVNAFLAQAAAHPHTFYGLLARRALGAPPAFDWPQRVLAASDIDVLTRDRGMRRALALVQIGALDRARAEARAFSRRVAPRESDAFLALCDHLNMPDIAMRLGRHLIAAGEPARPDAQFPLPQWRPPSGYVVDRALVFALMRQESGFNPRAKSHAGARGLMQLMPATARFIAGAERLGRVSHETLYAPEYNIELGQRYVRHLAESEEIGGSLFLLVAAYNAGPGNLRKWLSGMRFNDDPLLFIESLPSAETREFVEKVVANLWIYRERLGQPAPSLDATLAGVWPRYHDQDERRLADASDAETR